MNCSLPGSSVHGTFPTQALTPGLLHCRHILYYLSHQGSPRILEWVAYPFCRGSSWSGIKMGSSALQEDSLSAELPRKLRSLEKTMMLGKIEGMKRRGWQRMRCLDGNKHSEHEFEQDQGDGEGQGSLACCCSWGCKELDMTEQLNNNKIYKSLCNFQ